MLTRIVVMRPGAAEERRVVDVPQSPSYRELDALLRPLLALDASGGGHLEHVLVYVGDLPYQGEAYYRDMFIDEEGHAQLFELAADGGTATRTRPGKNLPRNDAATALYLRNWLMHKPASANEEVADDFIAGPAVLFPERRVWS